MTNLDLNKSDILNIADGLKLKKGNLMASLNAGCSDSDAQWILGQVKDINAILINLNKSADFYVNIGLYSNIR